MNHQHTYELNPFGLDLVDSQRRRLTGSERRDNSLDPRVGSAISGREKETLPDP